MGVEGYVPDGGFLFGSEPPGVLSRSAAVSGVEYEFMFCVVEVPGDYWKVFVPDHQGAVMYLMPPQPIYRIHRAVRSAGYVCGALGG